MPETDPTELPPAPLRNKGSDLEVDNLALEGVAPELASSDFLSQNYKTLATLMQEETKKSSDSEDNRRKRRKRVSSSSSDPSENEDEETRHWKSRNGYRNQEDEYVSSMASPKEDKRRRMLTNIKTYDGTGDPDDHLKIFESAATIENWPKPVWCHMFNSTLVGNTRNWFSKLPRRSIDGFEELRRAFCLNFTQRKKCAKNPVELARVKQRQGESTSAYVERYKDECIHVKACPEILKILGFMNGINNPGAAHETIQ
nr:reverse transcriptase domain-containing protein [Tanacetum cinerariifolium]